MTALPFLKEDRTNVDSRFALKGSYQDIRLKSPILHSFDEVISMASTFRTPRPLEMLLGRPSACRPIKEARVRHRYEGNRHP